MNVKKLPTIAELNKEFDELVAAKKKEYSEYRDAKEKMQAYSIARQNIEAILNSEEKRKEQNREKDEAQK